ncbi:MAG: S53 family peptidase, partial [Thermoplasmata archaeon]
MTMVSRPAGRPAFRIGVGALAIVALLLLGLVPAGASATTVMGPATRVTAGHEGHSDSSATFAERAGYAYGRLGTIADPTPALGTVEVVVTFEPTSSSLFATPAPGSKLLTVREVADQFGLTPANYSAMIQYFESRGLSVLHRWPDRLSLSLVGSEAAVGRAFSTSILSGSYQGRGVTFPATPPSLPTTLEAEVASVIGLSSGFDTFTLPSLSTATAVPGTGSPAQGSGDLVTPAIARSIYDLSDLYNLTSSPTYASTRSIAVLLWGVGYAPNDLTTFFQEDYPSSFPAPTIIPEPIDGAPSPSQSAVNDPCKVAQEMTLDLEWSGSMAPGATLYAVYPPELSTTSCQPSTASMADAMHSAIGLPVSTISMSFGTPESSDQGLVQAWNTYLAVGTHEGITFLAATGDTGGDASGGCSGGPSPQYPASSPDVLAVGGTDVGLTRNLLGEITGFSESAWNQSGGGFSTQFSAPNWQSATTGNAFRGMPDVSATAAENFVYFNGQSRVAGGTSFATPLWAGLLTEMAAIHGSSFGLISPRLYSVGSAEPSGKVGNGLADITTGSTCLGDAGPGWDQETGWGSPRALLLYEDLTAT